MKIRELFSIIYPFLVDSKNNSITLSFSKRFFLLKLANKIFSEMEDDPYLNFVSVLKNYKFLGKFLYGDIKEFYKDRNKFYFKNFFVDKTLYQLVKEDMEYLYPDYKHIKVIISKHGLLIYDNYKKNDFNTLLLTSHAGQWVPESIKSKILLSDKQRKKEEDIDSDKIYCKIVLDQGGIWVNNKLSRFVCDFNRVQDRSIYFKDSEEWMKRDLWDNLSKSNISFVHSLHSEFYATLTRLLDSYNFNIIFDGHTMKHKFGRPRISFGTKYTSNFYQPILRSMKSKMHSLGYGKVLFNKPYAGGFILKWLKLKFPDRFIFSMEINKKEYMSFNRLKTNFKKLEKLRSDIPKIFDLK